MNFSYTMLGVAAAIALPTAGDLTVIKRHEAPISIKVPAVAPKATKVSYAVASNEPVHKSYRERLAKLAALAKDWNGHGELPVSNTVVCKTQKVVDALPAGILERWHIFPDTNGTLLMTMKGKKFAVVSLGEESVSFVAKNGKSTMKGQSAFNTRSTVEHIINIVRFIDNGGD